MRTKWTSGKRAENARLGVEIHATLSLFVLNEFGVREKNPFLPVFDSLEREIGPGLGLTSQLSKGSSNQEATSKAAS